MEQKMYAANDDGLANKMILNVITLLIRTHCKNASHVWT